MALALPAALGYGKVVWTAISAIADGPADSDSLPDGIPVTGSVTFAPSEPELLIFGEKPTTVMATTVTYQLGADGVLRDAGGKEGIYLLANDAPGVSPSGWKWTVSYKLNNGLSRGSFSFDLPSGTTVDLTTVKPVAKVNGVPIIKGEKGDKGDPGLAPAPYYAGTLAGMFDQERSIYNLKGSNTRRLRFSLAAAAADAGLCRITFIGDSLTAGVTNTRGVDDAVSFLRKELIQRGYKTGEVSRWWGNDGAVVDPRVLVTDGNQVSVTFPWPQVFNGGPATITGTGTVFELVTTPNNNGAFHVAIDGAAPVTFNPGSGEGSDGYRLATIKDLSDGPHTAVVTADSAFYMHAVGFRYDTGIVLHNAGYSGSTSNSWSNQSGGEYSGLNTALKYADVDVAVVELGMNDHWEGAPTPLADYKASMRTVIGEAISQDKDVLLVVSNWPGDGDLFLPYVKAQYELADEFDLPLLDLCDRWGPTSEYDKNGLARDLSSDGLHLTAAGNAAKARAWMEMLAPGQVLRPVGTSRSTPGTAMRRDDYGTTQATALFLDWAPDAPSAATRKDYVDALGTDLIAPNSVVRRDASGGTRLGWLAVLANPVNPEDAVRKDYVDNAVSNSSVMASIKIAKPVGEVKNYNDQQWSAFPLGHLVFNEEPSLYEHGPFTFLDQGQVQAIKINRRGKYLLSWVGNLTGGAHGDRSVTPWVYRGDQVIGTVDAGQSFTGGDTDFLNIGGSVPFTLEIGDIVALIVWVTTPGKSVGVGDNDTTYVSNTLMITRLGDAP